MPLRQVHAALLLVGALARCGRHIVEYALFTTLSGATFIFSSECPVRAAEDAGTNPAAYVLGVLAITALSFAWVVHLALGVVTAPAAAATAPAGSAAERTLLRQHKRRGSFDGEAGASPPMDDAALELTDL